MVFDNMNKKLVSGCILSTTLLILISIAPTIYADIETPLEDDITIYEEEDCGCIEETPDGWNYPILCTILYPFVLFATFLIALQLFIFKDIIFQYLYMIVYNIALDLNCSYV